MQTLSYHFFKRIASHRIASSIIMLSMILLGLWAAVQLNVQFLPAFQVHEVNVDIIWRGAAAEDVQRSVSIPVEQELRQLSNIKELRVTSRLGHANLNIEFHYGTDMAEATERVRQKVSLVRNLPPDIEPPQIARVENYERLEYERIAKVVIATDGPLEALRPWVRKFENDLLSRGISRVVITGLTDNMIAVRVPMQAISENRLSLPAIAGIINQRSQDLPAGNIGGGQVTKQIRTTEQRRSIDDFINMPLVTDEQGRIIRLGDIASIEKAPRDHEVIVTRAGKPAVEFTLFRAEDANTLESAQILEQWVTQTKALLPEGVEIAVFDVSWVQIKERISMLIENGLQGLALILITLFLFLNRTVAFWVAAGIPVAFLAGMMVLKLTGGSIDMVSLFAFIMVLGIIVDDTIVVGEETLSQLQQNKPPHEAVALGASRMFMPVMASSATTICAFLPLMLLSDVIGKILFSIPLVVIAVIIASLIECFCVLPGHLYHSLHQQRQTRELAIKQWVDKQFNYFRDHIFNRWVKHCLRHPWTIITFSVASFILSIALVSVGWIGFTFFPTPDSTTIYANIEFIPGATEQHKQDFLKHLQQTLQQTRQEIQNKYGKAFVRNAVLIERSNPSEFQRGSQYAVLDVDVTPPAESVINNKTFIDAWRKKVAPPPEVDNFNIITRKSGPPGKDIEILLTGNTSHQLKSAARALRTALASYPGVYNINDDMPIGQEQLLFSLKPRGESIGLTTQSVGEQIRAAFTGAVAQIYHDNDDELEVRVLLPEKERDDLLSLEHLPIITPSNEVVLANDVLAIKAQQGFDILRRTDAKSTVKITASVDIGTTNANKVLDALKQNELAQVVQEHAVNFELTGTSRDERRAMNELKYGAGLGLILIYLILAWVFASYLWPIAVLSIIPLGLTGAIVGHFVFHMDLTMLSLFAFFGLSGIVINDSIILITRFRECLSQGLSYAEGLALAATQRLRPVLLTSITTTVGLLPLLFETSEQAQFLIPMAVSISFGLLFATGLILLVIPAILILLPHKQP